MSYDEALARRLHPADPKKITITVGGGCLGPISCEFSLEDGYDFTRTAERVAAWARWEILRRDPTGEAEQRELARRPSFFCTPCWEARRERRFRSERELRDHLTEAHPGYLL